MNVSLTPELEEYVAAKVKSGLYNSASEVVREGLRLVHEQDQLREIKLSGLKKEVQKGIDQLERGEFTEYESADELLADLMKDDEPQNGNGNR